MHRMKTTLTFDPSRPCQVEDDLLALWLPRGRGRDALASGLVATVDVCENPACPCTIARLHAIPIDDRAKRAVRNENSMRITWSDLSSKAPRPEGSAGLRIDFLTGHVEAGEGEALPPLVAPFFEEPLPFWVLDHICARWREPRPPLGFDWKAQALDHWEPGLLLSTMLVFPEERFDRYLVDGKVYQVDTLFCVAPDCTCTEARFCVLAVSEDGKRLDEVGTARMPPETMVPVGFDGAKSDLNMFTHLYLEWRRRNVPAEARLLELRDLTRQRGLELYRLIEARSRRGSRRPPAAASRPASSAAKPGRNAPCPCGSGKKYKRCCGRR